MPSLASALPATTPKVERSSSHLSLEPLQVGLEGLLSPLQILLERYLLAGKCMLGVAQFFALCLELGGGLLVSGTLLVQGTLSLFQRFPLLRLMVLEFLLPSSLLRVEAVLVVLGLGLELLLELVQLGLACLHLLLGGWDGLDDA